MTNRFAIHLQTLLDEGVSQGIPGVSAAVATRDGVVWAGTAGAADVQTGELVRADMLFGIGSITKTFIAVVILQLVEEGRVHLDDTVAGVLGDVVRGVANAEHATITQLLNHTSGVPSWEDDSAWIRDGRGISLEVERLWGKSDTLEYIKGLPPVETCGAKYAYSNTNYTLLGLIIERITGLDAVIEIDERILKPLGLQDIYLEGFEPVPQERLSHRYHGATADFQRDAGVNAAFTEVRPELIDASRSNLSVEWTAGGMVATARDLALYGAALRDGKLLAPQSMRLLTQWVPAGETIQVGHNVFREEHPGGFALIGHNGGVLGFSATLYWIESADAVVAALCNVGVMHSGAGPKGLNSVVKTREFLETVLQLTSDRSNASTIARRVRLPSHDERALTQKVPFLWLNEHWQPLQTARAAAALDLSDVHDAERRWQQFAGLLAELFPELAPSGGIIESPLFAADALQKTLMGQEPKTGRWLIKGDHALPVAGSIKARGGIYEVLLHAEHLALREGLLRPHGDRLVLASAKARELFAQHEIAVGSTGNLGLSIGLMAAALGFRATVHMSSDAKEWKKARLRGRGVEVIEHEGDFGVAVAAGREKARLNTNAYFVDDENSAQLFLGYSVAALRLGRQLTERGVRVDSEHPLFVYLPCGVGGAPGGITFGLRHLFGDHVHCFFAEPTASPCMLIRLASADNRPISVREVGLDNRTEADGLAVGRASDFVAPLMRPLVSGIFTVPDEDLFNDLYVLERTEGLRVEPSAAAGFRGPRWLLESAVGRRYLVARGLSGCTDNATHILWTTGGAFVPEAEYCQFHQRGRNACVDKQLLGR
jgi:D-serine dehydratase